ncbi:MAG: DUF1028 domain-containing protein [Anaerolineales bacterium]|nr:DUF1028 domain-containing protein [Anaerolineales bacterium]
MEIRQGGLNTTYSIVARDPESGNFGVAVQTHQMCVGSAVPWLEAGVGAVATQSLTNVHFGPLGLRMLREGVAAQKVLAALVASDPEPSLRQAAVVDSQGCCAAWTGERCIKHAGHHIGDGFSVQANMMLSDQVVSAMARAYMASKEDFAGKLMAALQAAQQEGGDIRGMQSAALKIVSGETHTSEGEAKVRAVYDVRVDESEQPLLELGRLVRLRRAQLLSDAGNDLLTAGEKASALEVWARARAMAPELEELAYWQALALADEPADTPGAAALLREMLENTENRMDWLELLRRLEPTGIMKREGAVQELLGQIKK